MEVTTKERQAGNESGRVRDQLLPGLLYAMNSYIRRKGRRYDQRLPEMPDERPNRERDDL